MSCVHCGARGIARAMAKDQHEPMTWYIDYQCDNVYCGHTYRVRLKMTPYQPRKYTKSKGRESDQVQPTQKVSD
nr:ogr/Delta-like zinc finger family protein [Burkholderia diffusa]